MNKTLSITYRTLTANLNLKNAIYLLFILLTSLIFFQFNIFPTRELNLNNLQVVEALFTNKFLWWGFIWLIGIPAFLYFSFLISNSISREITSGTALLIFTRPVKRIEFVLGRFLGFWLFFNLINAVILFFIPALQNLLFRMPNLLLFPMYKISFLLLLYSFFFTAIISSLGVLLSSKFKKSLISLAAFFVLFILTYFLPIINSQLRIPNLPYLLKPFFSLPFSYLNLLPAAAKMLNLFTNTYQVSPLIVINNFINPFAAFILIFFLILLFLVLACFVLVRQDIT